MARLFRCPIRDTAIEGGSIQAVFNLDQLVYAFPNPYQPDTTFVRMTGETNVFVVMAAFDDLRHEIEEANDG